MTTIFRTATKHVRHVAFSLPLSLHASTRTVLPTSRNASNVPRCATRRPRTRTPPHKPPPTEAVSIPKTLGSELKKKVQQGAPRKAMDMLEAAEAPVAADFRMAARAFIRTDRPDFALTTFRLREKSAHTPAPDPALSAAVLRACLRGQNNKSYKRDARRDLALGVGECLDALLRDVDSISDSAPAPYALALCQVQAALLQADDTKGALKALDCLSSLASYGERAAAKSTDYNDLIRMYGKARRIDSVFAVMDAMRAAQVATTHETFEFLANAAVRSVSFVKGAVSMETLPPQLPAEVAFCGRSNVGKSSLVNMLCNRKALAKVSNTPGKTQQFNYFSVNNDTYYLVDLPGVGYARVSKSLRQDWIYFMEQYFALRESLRVVFHLVDGRHGPMEDDEELMGLLSTCGFGGEYVVVLTKMDKMDKEKVKSSVIQKTRNCMEKYGWLDTPIVATSSQTKLGRDELWRFLQGALKGTVSSL